MISGSLCGQLVAQQSISEMGSSKNTKASGVLAHVHVNLNVPTFSAVQIDHGLLKMNVQSMLDDFQVKLMSRDSLESIAESTRKSKNSYIELIKMTQMDFSEENEEVEDAEEPQESGRQKKKS